MSNETVSNNAYYLPDAIEIDMMNRKKNKVLELVYVKMQRK